MRCETHALSFTLSSPLRPAERRPSHTSPFCRQVRPEEADHDSPSLSRSAAGHQCHEQAWGISQHASGSQRLHRSPAVHGRVCGTFLTQNRGGITVSMFSNITASSVPQTTGRDPRCVVSHLEVSLCLTTHRNAQNTLSPLWRSFRTKGSPIPVCSGFSETVN